MNVDGDAGAVGVQGQFHAGDLRQFAHDGSLRLTAFESVEADVEMMVGGDAPLTVGRKKAARRVGIDAVSVFAG